MSRAPVARRGVGVSRLAERLDAGTILTAILVLGLALRIFIAGAYLPRSGLSNDIGAFTAWAMRLASVGPSQFYEPGYFADYPPGYMYVLWLLGTIGDALASIVGQNATGGLVKVPGILADVGVGWLLFLICRRWGDELIDRTTFRVSAETLGVVAVTLYMFNPGTIFDSSVWGQIDSVGAFLLLGTIYALGRGWTEVAAAGAVLALLVKFQFAFLIPLVAIVGLRRHMFGRSTDASHHGKRDPLRVLTSLAVGFGAVTALLLPFRMTLYAPLSGGDPRGLLGILPAADPNRSLIGKFLEAANTYDGLTVNAFSMWRNPWSGLGDTFQRADDAAVAITLGWLALSWQQVGAVLFGAVALLAFVQVARRDDMRGVLVASLLLAIAFFVLPTRVHERYLFPALALAAPLVFSGRVWPWVYGALSLCFFANIYWVYTEDWSFAGGVINPGANGLPMPQDPFLAATVLTDVGIWLIVLLGVAVLGFVGWRAWLTAVHPRGLATTGDAAWATDGGPAPLAADRTTPDVATREGRPPRPRFGWLTPNPADLYLREPTRRLDRRDAMLLLALVVFALVFRLWRLDVPRGTHFDEVYHARSATEFLSNWQNGWDRDVYEWTHPMLAKYLIAAGIVIADPNKVVGSADLDAPSPSMAVAPQRSSMGHDRSVVFSAAAGGVTIVATDVESGEEVTRWDAGGPVASIAFDPDSTRLLVGRADAGTVEVYALTDLMSSDGAAAPPVASPPIAIELGAASQVEMVADSDVVLVRGPDGVAVVDSTTDSVRATATGSYGGVAWVGSSDDDAGWLAATDPERNAIVFLAGDTLELAVDAEGEEQGVVAIEPPLVGPLLTRGSGADQQLLALTGPVPANDEHPETAGSIVSMDADAQTLNDVVPLPGAPSLLGYQPVAGIVYVAGVSAAGEPTVWPIEPHIDDRNDTSAGLAAFDATSLPAPALAMAFDVSAHGQSDDHGRLVVSTGDGTLVSVDAGSNAFAWRVAGVAFGAALVALVYLLGATMFGRRRLAALAAGFVAVDGMSYVMSRIAMNDIFVTVFIVAAYLAFWQIWSGRWARSAWWVLPLVGVLIGLAAATKWVGFYALAGIWILVLARSSLGRLVLVGLVAFGTVVGGLGAPWPFLVTMLLATAIAMAIVHQRPIRLDVRAAMVALPATGLVIGAVGIGFAVAYGQIDHRDANGAVEVVFGMLARGAQVGWPAWVMLGIAGVLIAWRAWRSLRDANSDARWHQPDEMGGFAWSWVGACLVVVPLTVYALSYIPYLQLGHAFAGPDSGPGYGWSLEELHAQMFGYHFGLTAGHASSSPWWSWPLDLKPTWFFNGSYDGEQIAVIYNGGNPILFWAGVPAIAACGVLAWKRRSAALVLLVAAFAFQLAPWTRIERATFAYHYLTAVIFAMIAVAYVVDELLRRPAWRDVALGYLALVVVAGVLVFPLGAALPMPDWYINAARALPPWNYAFQFPDPPQGDRGDLVSISGMTLVVGVLVAVAAVAWSLRGRQWGAPFWSTFVARRRVRE